MTSPVRKRLAAVLPLLALLPGLTTAPLAAQDAPLRLGTPDGEAAAVEVALHRGYPAFPADALAEVGWTLEAGPGAWTLAFADEARVAVHPGLPFLRWGDALVQLVSAPYLLGDRLYLPLQFAVDLVPDRLPTAFRLGEGRVLQRVAGSGAARRPVASSGATPVVVIDPGHGGDDPGAMGPGGTREKDVALAVGRALAQELERRGGVEVHLTRERDVLVPLWRRGEEATRLKGDRPGVFISIHTNAVADRSVRGVETYFLSDARTEHERRVAALENASLALDGDGRGPAHDGLDFILSELRNHDHLHWSADLADAVQGRVARTHPGPDRGVKQAPFAVITNALMPAVLVEMGFITHPLEEGVLAKEAFHRDVARALADAVEDFFLRYPPGRAATSGR